jgi:hypothetical protein
MAAGILALLCLGGVGVGISLYDEATEIDRSHPAAVVDSFLGAYLVNRDDNEAKLYQCESDGDFAELARYRNDIITREKQFTVGIRVSWSSLTVATSESEGTVTTDIIKTASDSARLSNTWRFGVVNEDGWRVCSATMLS